MADNSEMVLTLEERIVRWLTEKKYTITTAESCTGGLLSGRLINVSGVSECLKEAYVTYCDASKNKILGVTRETLKTYTAVSAQTAEEMARGGAAAADADICLSVTGVAGPLDEGKDFPAGLVYIGCFFCGKVSVRQFHFSGGRAAVREQAVEAALAFLWSMIQEQ